MIIMGTDPGMTGAIGWIECTSPKTFGDYGVEDLPMTKKGLDAEKTRDLFEKIQQKGSFLEAPTFLLEKSQPMPGQGISSTSKYMYLSGILHGIAVGLGFDVYIIRPQDWKKRLHLTSDKEDSLRLARETFPEVAHLLRRKKDHNRAEALLISYAALDHTW